MNNPIQNPNFKQLNIFIIGSKGIPAKYGGFETFVDELTKRKNNNNLKYHVACIEDKTKEDFEYNEARCFNIVAPKIGGARAVIYDLRSIKQCYEYIKENNIQNCTIYILACRIGPFMFRYKKKLEKLGVKICVNPDGHEWKRSKWNALVRAYWKYSEKLMVKHADYLICDSIGIEEYIKESYSRYSPTTTYISYGSDITVSSIGDNDEKIKGWYRKHNLNSGEYFLIVGRFVPENNYLTMINEFMKNATNKDLVIITNFENNKFFKSLKEYTKFESDKRIKFVGTVYETELLKKIRENAFAYIHGHEVGGTNPSLLEALASTKINILLDVNFNKEVGRDAALYFSKDEGSLNRTIDIALNLSTEEVNILGEKSTSRINKDYSWESIVNKYENFFISTSASLDKIPSLDSMNQPLKEFVHTK